MRNALRSPAELAVWHVFGLAVGCLAASFQHIANYAVDARSLCATNYQSNSRIGWQPFLTAAMGCGVVIFFAEGRIKPAMKSICCISIFAVIGFFAFSPRTGMWPVCRST